MTTFAPTTNQGDGIFTIHFIISRMTMTWPRHALEIK